MTAKVMTHTSGWLAARLARAHSWRIVSHLEPTRPPRIRTGRRAAIYLSTVNVLVRWFRCWRVDVLVRLLVFRCWRVDVLVRFLVCECRCVSFGARMLACGCCSGGGSGSTCNVSGCFMRKCWTYEWLFERRMLRQAAAAVARDTPIPSPTY
jgi:hypothetical protein